MILSYKKNADDIRKQVKATFDEHGFLKNVITGEVITPSTWEKFFYRVEECTLHEYEKLRDWLNNWNNE